MTFVESARFEQGQTGSFYLTGSSPSLGYEPGTFASSLVNKEQIRVSFSVKRPVRMLPTSSSIYYFHFGRGEWNIPTRSVGDHVGPFDKYAMDTTSIKTYGSTGQQCTPGTVYPEDYKGFDPRGRALASGSSEIIRQVITSSADRWNQTIRAISAPSKTLAIALEAASDDYPNSIQRSSLYEASSDEKFSLNIDAPFLIEKVVLEVPIAAGAGWFNDRTLIRYSATTGTFNYTTASSPSVYVDSGGPGLTFALFCQKSYGTSSIRDLVSSGTVTHSDDTTHRLVVRDIPTVLWPDNVKSKEVSWEGMTPSTHVGSTTTMTGSVVVPMEVASTNGALGAFVRILSITGSYTSGTSGNRDSIFTPTDFLTYVDGLLSNDKIPQPKTFEALQWLYSGIDPYGRGMTGFSPSCASIFGGEYETPAAFGGQNYIKNPYYTPDASEKATAYATISSSLASELSVFTSSYPNRTLVNYYFLTDFAHTATKQSPYLAKPGDRFVLAVTKTRPAVSASGHNVPTSSDVDVGRNYTHSIVYATGSTGHDVSLTSGTINMTLYGSYVQFGRRARS